jgi:hypothetical protein
VSSANRILFVNYKAFGRSLVLIINSNIVGMFLTPVAITVILSD